MNLHRYILEPYKGMNSRYHCPQCQSRNKTFSKYIDTETGEYLSPDTGKCERLNNCGYHYTPKQYFTDNNISFDMNKATLYQRKHLIRNPVSFIPTDVFKASLKGHSENNFVSYLVSLFGSRISSDVISRYFIATSKHWQGATVFWQIDTTGKIRTGKIMLYSPDTGKRVKEPFNHISWVHKAIKQPDFNLKQCFFGEHLLIDKTKPVAIVESEKTAIIASVYLPQFIWLAVGSLTNLNANKCSILFGRIVTLFPDLNAFDIWSSKAKELSHIATFTISDLLEHIATDADKAQGLDLADYLTKFSVDAFAIPDHEETEQKQQESEYVEFEQVIELDKFIKPKQTKLESWDKEIAELKEYFATIVLPDEPIKLNQCSTISNSTKFIESHLATITANNGKQNFLPYLNRLITLKKDTRHPQGKTHHAPQNATEGIGEVKIYENKVL